MKRRREKGGNSGTPSVTNGRIANATILMAAVLLAMSAFAQDPITDVMSPVVSYQFRDSLEHLEAGSVVMSPVASYQYFDWPDAESVQFLNSPDVSYFYGSGGTVANVRASQRTGTMLVDLFYDLGGAGLDYSVSVSVSSDGGASLAVPATHFSGDGVTSLMTPGANRHIVWDAGADVPDQFSTRMRVGVALNGSANAALSPIFTLDTRAVLTGTLTGLVQGSGIPIVNAQVRIDGTGFIASTGTDGRFALENVPTRSGYLLTVSAAGYASRQKAGISVSTGTSDVGVIQLTPLAGPYRLVSLRPDVNPAVTQIEKGGVAYRYYKLLPANEDDNLGGVAVTLRKADGTTIPQDGDRNALWPGSQAGTVDPDGIVRLRIPAGEIGEPGVSATFEVVESGTVKQTFTAQVVPRKYEQVWKHEWEGERGWGLPLWYGVKIKGATHQMHRTTVMREYDGPASREIVGRVREDELKVGVSMGEALRVGRTGGGATEGLGGAVGVVLGTSFHFTPDTTDPTANPERSLCAE